MKILAPVNTFQEAQAIIDAGADELYCGVMPPDWKKKYTNIASPNRREWTAANLADFGELESLVAIAHSRQVPLYLAVNAFYTREQYPLIIDQITRAERLGVDAFIIGDLGLLLTLKEMGSGIVIHISNTGTVFNSEAVSFYKDLGARRIILPRQLSVQEIGEIAASDSSMEFEVFIMNSGCKNIDGFCTFHHGVSEITYPRIWNFFKKMHVDHYLLECTRRLPFGLSRRLKGSCIGIDSACLLDYSVSPVADAACHETVSGAAKIAAGFNLLSGADPCGACDLYALSTMGIDSLKIVGRNYPTAKKVKDVSFLKTMLSSLKQGSCASEEDFKSMTKAAYKRIYKTDCSRLCYRCSHSQG